MNIESSKNKNTPLASLNCISICTVLGLALDSKGLAKLYRKFDGGKKYPSAVGSRFQLLHKICHEDGPIPDYLTKLFDDRFSVIRDRVRRMTCENEQEIAAALGDRTACASAGILWALLTDSRPPFREYGTYLVHCFSYRSFQEIRQQDVAERQSEKVVEQLTADLDRARSKEQQQREKTGALRFRLHKAEEAAEALRIIQNRQAQQITQMEATPDEMRKLRRDLRMAEYALEQGRQDEEAVVEERNAKQAAPVLSSRSSCDSCETCDDQDVCPLEALQVAVVGGLDRLEPRYREVVEALGGDFVFHNGDCHGGSQTLKNMVCRSDIVVFVTRLNSHSALRVVKGLCQKTGNYFVALRETGPQALAEALRSVA